MDVRDHGGSFSGSKYKKGVLLERTIETKQRYLKSNASDIGTRLVTSRIASRRFFRRNILHLIATGEKGVSAFFGSEYASLELGFASQAVVKSDGTLATSGEVNFSLAKYFVAIYATPDRKRIFVVDEAKSLFWIDANTGVSTKIRTLSGEVNQDASYIPNHFDNCFTFFYGNICSKNDSLGNVVFEKTLLNLQKSTMSTCDERQGNYIFMKTDGTIDIMNTDMSKLLETIDMKNLSRFTTSFSNSYTIKFLCEKGILYMSGGGSNYLNLAAFDLDKKIFLWEISENFSYKYSASSYDLRLDAKDGVYVSFGRNSTSPSNSSGGLYMYDKKTGLKTKIYANSTASDNNGGAYYAIDVMESRDKEQDYVLQYSYGNAYNDITGTSTEVRSLDYSHIEII